MGRALHIVDATTSSPLLSKTGFKGYDICLNSYVGCAFGCSFCYVRFFIKDKEYDWGDFLRIRRHVATKLPKELRKPKRAAPVGGRAGEILRDSAGQPLLEHEGKRLVIGTMTDPYQPAERQARVTRAALKIILDNPILSKVGIFTRSPIVLEDLDLITKLPRARVHYSISPFPLETIRKLEPIGIQTSRRLQSIKALKEAGLRVHVNVAPAIPIYSERVTEELAQEIGKLGVDEFFVDPVQPYDESFKRMRECLQGEATWPQVEQIVTEKARYLAWKQQYWDSWKEAWGKYGSPNTLAIWSDHENHVWRKLISGEHMNPQLYGDDLRVAE